MMLKAVMDRIIVRLDEKETSKLILNDKMFIQNQGTVVSVGPQVTQVKTGEHIVFHRFDELPLTQDNLVVIRESSLLAVCDK